MLVAQAELGEKDKLTRYRLRFFWPDRRNRDEDNAEASCKAYLDGCADAFGINDREFRKCESSEFSLDRANPRLEIEFEAP